MRALGPLPADWRAYSDAQETDVEIGESIQLGDGVRATRNLFD